MTIAHHLFEKSRILAVIFGSYAAFAFAGAPAAQAQTTKPNILVIFGDDIGMWNISAYHRGMMGGSTPDFREKERPLQFRKCL